MKRLGPVLLLLGCGALFAGTFFILLKWRFETGDIYPPYSSLRTDPLGTMALYESLQQLPGLSVKRDFKATNQLPPGRDTLYLHIAAYPEDWEQLPEELVRTVEQFLFEGGRLVVTLKPRFTDSAEEKTEKAARKGKDAKREESPASPSPTPSASPAAAEDKKPAASPTPREEDEEIKTISLEKQWGLHLATLASGESKNDSPLMVTNVSGLDLPPKLAWHGDIVLEQPDNTWKVIYSRKEGAVLAEKSFGRGSLVMMTDSYYLSNEAMPKDRHANLLVWLIGPCHQILFDEAHHGIVDNPGIAGLARKYQLHGAVAALLVLAGLFVWKNASSLAPPPRPQAPGDNAVAGRESAAGFAGLLRRNIPAGDILAICLEEWNHTFQRSSAYTSREKAAVAAIAGEEETRPGKDRDVGATYRRLQAALDRKAAVKKNPTP